MDPTDRRASTSIATPPIEVKRSRTSSKSTAAFNGSAAAIKDRLNRAQEVAHSLNRQLGNLLHFIAQSSYLAIEASEDKPQEILWVTLKKSSQRCLKDATGSDAESASEETAKSDKAVETGGFKIQSKRGLESLPSNLRDQVERLIEEQGAPMAAGIKQDSQLAELQAPDSPNPESHAAVSYTAESHAAKSYTAESNSAIPAPSSKGWSYDVLLLRPDHEVVPEATISYPAVGLNDDGDVCFLADVYPEKLAAAQALNPSDQSLRPTPPQVAEALNVTSNTASPKPIDVAQLFWDALTRAGVTANIPLNLRKD